VHRRASLRQRDADYVLVVAQVELAVGHGRVGPRVAAHLGAGQLVVVLHVGVEQHELARLFE
jgi:hypothetical protein